MMRTLICVLWVGLHLVVLGIVIATALCRCSKCGGYHAGKDCDE